MEPIPSFSDLAGLAGELNLPIAWLRAEALAGRIPYFKVGRRLWFDVGQVRAALLARANEHAVTDERVEAVRE